MLSRLIKAVSQRMRQRNPQEEIDILKVCLLVDLWEHARTDRQWPPARGDELAALSFDDQAAHAAAGVHKQLVAMFESTARSDAEQLDFSLQVCGSSAAGAGEGVFLHGGAEAGSVVCLYPGKVYAPDMLDQVTVEHIFGGGDGAGSHVIGRYDRVFIDGGSAAAVAPNPFGLGHMINHPPAGTEPNVIPLAFDFADDDSVQPEAPPFPVHLRNMVPNEYARKPSLLVERAKRPHVLSPGLVLIATRRLRDEELFLNYRLNPALAPPAWYMPWLFDSDPSAGFVDGVQWGGTAVVEVLSDGTEQQLGAADAAADAASVDARDGWLGQLDYDTAHECRGGGALWRELGNVLRARGARALRVVALSTASPASCGGAQHVLRAQVRALDRRALFDARCVFLDTHGGETGVGRDAWKLGECADALHQPPAVRAAYIAIPGLNQRPFPAALQAVALAKRAMVHDRAPSGTDEGAHAECADCREALARFKTDTTPPRSGSAAGAGPAAAESSTTQAFGLGGATLAEVLGLALCAARTEWAAAARRRISRQQEQLLVLRSVTDGGSCKTQQEGDDLGVSLPLALALALSRALCALGPGLKALAALLHTSADVISVTNSADGIPRFLLELAALATFAADAADAAVGTVTASATVVLELPNLSGSDGLCGLPRPPLAAVVVPSMWARQHRTALVAAGRGAGAKAAASASTVPVVTVHPPVNVSLFRRVRGGAMPQRACHQADSATFHYRIGCVARLEPVRGVGLLLLAVSRAASALREWASADPAALGNQRRLQLELVIVGDGPLRADLGALARGLGQCTHDCDS
eukprot:g3916.t1